MAAASSQAVILGIKVHSSDGLTLMKSALRECSRLVKPAAISSVYRIESEAEVNAHVHDLRSYAVFEGLVLALNGFTALSPTELAKQLRVAEDEFRNEALRQSVSVSLNFYGTSTLMTPNLTLPDPDFHLRPENVLPAAEISPEFVHPVLQKTLRELARPFVSTPWGEFVAQGKAMLDF